MTGRKLLNIHRTGMVIWPLLAIPTLLLWSDSVLWIAFMSLYANFWLHVDGYGAARAEES